MRAIRHRPKDPQGWEDRVAAARSRVAAAASLEALAEALNGPAFAGLPLPDLLALPSFGGERPEGPGCFSWDAARVLVMNAAADGFEIRRR
ncbi:MAG TPA: hypothetical protein VLS93_17375 [Anaeromyxobacteraceae bacterium]|nr:hypothetical protein [Anaeromyxobacteraceae bacterium]